MTNSNLPSLTRPGAASSLSAPPPASTPSFSLRRYQRDVSSHHHDYAADPALSFLVQESPGLPAALGDRPFIELDEPQRHYLAFLHQQNGRLP